MECKYEGNRVHTFKKYYILEQATFTWCSRIGCTNPNDGGTVGVLVGQVVIGKGL